MDSSLVVVKCLVAITLLQLSSACKLGTSGLHHEKLETKCGCGLPLPIKSACNRFFHPPRIPYAPVPYQPPVQYAPQPIQYAPQPPVQYAPQPIQYAPQPYYQPQPYYPPQPYFIPKPYGPSRVSEEKPSPKVPLTLTIDLPVGETTKPCAQRQIVQQPQYIPSYQPQPQYVQQPQYVPQSSCGCY